MAADLLEQEILNVGILAGKGNLIRRLLTAICAFSVGRPVKIADQAAFNMIARLTMKDKQALVTSNNDTWCCNLGTSMDARIERQYSGVQISELPVFSDGYYLNYQSEKYYIIHQYDRVPRNIPVILQHLER